MKLQVMEIIISITWLSFMNSLLNSFYEFVIPSTVTLFDRGWAGSAPE